jgi:hypothetical protein
MSLFKRTWPRWLVLSAKIVLLGGLFLFAAAIGSVGYFEFGSPERTCLSCHELQKSYDRWTHSAHRDVSCKQCHGRTVASGWHGATENFKRMVAHFRDTSHDNMRLSEEQVVRIMKECRQCHASEFAQWQHGGHGVAYSDIFLDKKHNKTEQAAEDCLRCHGMFFKGSVADVVEPLNTKGPWRLKDASLCDRPAIPCLACHQVHVAADTAASRKAAKDGKATSAPHDAVCLYSRRDCAYVAAIDLPIPEIVDRGRKVQVSTDPKQRVCTQCHAPDAFGRIGTGDDRTPTGVHEGLSCTVCHAPHSNDARSSCVACHPKFSHCGLDVAKMDTTFRSSDSRHNIHRVSCSDCHASGVPEIKKSAASPQPHKNDKKTTDAAAGK